jgi:hypothetical protein
MFCALVLTAANTSDVMLMDLKILVAPQKCSQACLSGLECPGGIYALEWLSVLPSRLLRASQGYTSIASAPVRGCPCLTGLCFQWLPADMMISLHQC